MATTLAKTLDTLDNFAYAISKQAIVRAGGDHADLPIRWYRIAPEDWNSINKQWIVTYGQQQHETERDTIGQTVDYETNGVLYVMFALPGKAATDDSLDDRLLGDNWGDLLTQEALRRAEAQTCRAVANEFCVLMQKTCNLENLQITDFKVVENAPHTISAKLIWWSYQVEMPWKLHWHA